MCLCVGYNSDVFGQWHKNTHMLWMYLIVFGKGLSYREGKSLEQNTKKKFNIGLMKCQTKRKWDNK